MKFFSPIFFSLFFCINISFAENITNEKNIEKSLLYSSSVQFLKNIKFQTEKKYVFFVRKLQNITKYKTYSHTPQFVVLAFDGSYSLDMWKKTRNFSQEMLKKNIPVRFTYFISGVYFIPENLSYIYDLDGYKTGRSDIGWGDNEDDISRRIHQVNMAFLEGHEIGSHANGHFDGTDWTEETWEKEFDYFNRFLFPKFDGKYKKLNIFQKKITKLYFTQDEIKGFRAPLLGHNNAMYSALQKYGFTYETNKIFFQKEFPEKGLQNIWEMPLAGIVIDGHNTISMDYNLYYLQTKGKNILKKGTPQWDKAYNDILQGYREYFYNSYNNNRAPVFIGHHFSLWNDGLYWEVMKNFAREVCGKPDVVCGTNNEVTVYMENKTN